MITLKRNGVEQTLYSNSTYLVLNESVQVMSDIWEYMPVAYSINERGGIDGQALYGDAIATIDVSEDAYLRHRDFVYSTNLEYLTHKWEAQAQDPAEKGRVVKVVRGKTSRGTQGKVVAVIQRPYSMGYRSSNEPKLAIALNDEMTTYTAKNGKQYPTHKNIVWVWARNCVVVSTESAPMENLKQQASQIADQSVAKIKKQASEYWMANGKKHWNANGPIVNEKLAA